jgi:cysteine desulfurase
MAPREIYLDHNATTPPHPDVLAAMDAANRAAWGNPSSVHRAGQRARAELDRARQAVGRRLGLHPRDVILTSGGTESNNLALAARFAGDGQGGVVVGAVEHPSVLEAARALGRRGVPVAIARVAGDGRVEPDELARAAAELGAVALVSLQAVNHETGVIQPVAAAAELARARGAWLHVDAVQAIGKLDADAWAGADLVSLAAHKLRGPKGIGALATRPHLRLRPLLFGGEQERGLRPGTQAAALAAGLACAAERAVEGPSRHAALAALRDALETRLVALGGAVNGSAARAPHVTNLSFDGWRAPELCAALDLEGVFVASGSACSAGTATPSPVVTAMLGEARAACAVRVSLGETTTEADIEVAGDAFARVLARAERVSRSRST